MARSVTENNGLSPVGLDMGSTRVWGGSIATEDATTWPGDTGTCRKHPSCRSRQQPTRGSRRFSDFLYHYMQYRSANAPCEVRAKHTTELDFLASGLLSTPMGVSTGHRRTPRTAEKLQGLAEKKSTP